MCFENADRLAIHASINGIEMPLEHVMPTIDEDRSVHSNMLSQTAASLPLPEGHSKGRRGSLDKGLAQQQQQPQQQSAFRRQGTGVARPLSRVSV